MNKLIIPLLFMLILSTFVSAQIFDEDTQISEGNVNYIFEKGLEIEGFEPSPYGIKIDADGKTNKYGFTVEGGVLTITFHDIDDISFKSSVPQTINFEITLDGDKQYLYDGTRYFHNSITLTTEEERFDATDLGVNEKMDAIIDFGDEIKDVKFWEQKMIEFEISQFVDDKGIIHSETFSITYLWFTFIMFIVILLLIILWRIL